ncbi:MAG TPA: universal stress protein [Propionibacteriaceae bacterium]|nr:universal stress protein [Propionibacteriaceae bacterium]
MSVAVAHQVSPTGRIALREGGREAALRKTDLAVLHVVETLDLDIAASYRSGVSDEVEKVLAEAGLSDLKWDLHLGTGREHVAETVLKLASDVNAELLVIGARRRSPVGKFLLGSVTQTIILDANMPVVVVKPTA